MMKREYATTKLSDCPGNWPVPAQDEVQEIIHVLEYLGLKCIRHNDVEGLGPRWVVNGPEGMLNCSDDRELSWFARRLRFSIRYHVRRWRVIEAYFQGDETVKQAILEWIDRSCNAPWDATYYVKCHDIYLPHLKDIFKLSKKEVLKPGLHLHGLTVTRDLPGGEHIEAKNRDKFFFGAIEREIRREEWRRARAQQRALFLSSRRRRA